MNARPQPALLPEYLSVSRDALGEGQPVGVSTVEDREALAERMAAEILDEIHRAAAEGRAATLILPVGPVDQFPLLAERINRERVDAREVVLINMDEYLDDEGEWVPLDHPLSFRGYVQRAFYDLLDPELAPRPEHRVFPDPRRPEQIPHLIRERGGVDAVFGGIGINGHMAFNEPPEPGETMSTPEFAALPTRVLELSRETRTINANTVGGEISVIPRLAVTVGMKEILESRRARFYCNRPWQSAVVRRVLHGPVTAACPASLLRTHPDASITVTEEVARPPDIRLR